MFIQLSRLCDFHCGQLLQTRMLRRFQMDVGAVIRVVLLTIFRRWNANDAMFAWSPWKVQIKNVSVAQVKFGYMFHKAFHALQVQSVDAMLPRMSVRSRFSSWSVSAAVFGDGVKTLFGAFFVPHAKAYLFDCNVVSFCGKGDYHFLFQQAFCLVCSSVRSRPTLRGLYCCNVQHLLCLQLCLSFVCRCLCLRFVVRAGHANRAFIIDMHVFCATLQTNTDS